MKKGDLISMTVLALFCVVFWNALDFIHASVVSGGTYSFSAFNDLCLPAVIGVTVGYITAVRRGKAGR